jgi:hypothetical protein
VLLDEEVEEPPKGGVCCSVGRERTRVFEVAADVAGRDLMERAVHTWRFYVSGLSIGVASGRR